MSNAAPQRCQPSLEPVRQSAPLINRLRDQGKDAFAKHYSLGMFKLCTEAADRIEELEKALEPFAKMADLAHENHRDIRPVIFGFDTAVAQRLTIGDLRAARRALPSSGEAER